VTLGVLGTYRSILFVSVWSSEQLMSDKSITTILACPECGYSRFSWILKQVQYGTIHEVDGRYAEEGTKRGRVLDTDYREQGVFCPTCQEDRDLDDLVPREKVLPICHDCGNQVAFICQIHGTETRLYNGHGDIDSAECQDFEADDAWCATCESHNVTIK
jgi:hypothetical protein